MAGLDPWIGARWINAVLLAANTVLMALLIRRILGGGHVLPLLAALLFLVSSESLSAHGWAWSEPLFMFLGFLGLLLLDGYLEDGRRVNLIAAGSLLGLCAYTRYIGASFVLVSLVALAFRGGRQATIKARSLDLVAFVALSCTPVTIWSLRNFSLVGSLGGDVIRMRAIPVSDWLAVYRAISLWFVPGRIPDGVRDGLMLGLVGIFAVLSILAVGRAGQTPIRGSVRLARMILLFVLVYVTVLVGSRVFLRVRVFAVPPSTPVWLCCGLSI
jgi:hypothetical protein